MTSVAPVLLDNDFQAQAPAAAEKVEAAELDSQFFSFKTLFNDLLQALGVSIRDDNTLTDSLVRLRNLHPEITTLIASAGGWVPLTAVACASVANLTLSGEQTIDGVLTSASRILVKDQTTGSQNGVYITGAGAWSRATDADSAAELGYAVVYVSAGLTNGGGSWIQTVAAASITVATTTLTWVQLNGRTSIPDVGTMASLKDISPTGLTNNQTVRLLGYYAAGDGGEGVFRWNSGSTTTDNGGTVIQPTAGGAGRWNRIFTGNQFDVHAFGAKGDGVTNDTAALAAAIAAASSAGGCTVNFHGGCKYLSDGNLSVANVALVGTGVCDGETPYTDNGAQIWQTNTANPMFTVAGFDVLVQGLVFYYPSQDGSGVSPTVYAPTFRFATTASVGNVTFRDCQWTNAYDCIEAIGAIGYRHGRVMISDCRAYAFRSFLRAKYVADVIQVTSCEITPGIWQDVAITGNAYPAKWTSSNGKAFYVDTQCDGLDLTNVLAFGYKYGVYADTGTINWLGVVQCTFDQCAYGVYGNNAALTYAVIDGSKFWATHSYDATVLGYSIYVGGGSLVGSMAVTGCTFGKSYGGHFQAPAQAFRAITIQNNVFLDWATGTGVAADQAAVLLNNSAGADAVISGNVFSCQGTPTFNPGISVLADQAAIRGNTFRKCKVCVNIIGAGNYVVEGNLSTATVGATCFQATSATIIANSGNIWDKVASGIVDTITATVNFPNMASPSTATLDISFPGAQAGDCFAIGLPNAGGHTTNGIMFQAWYQAADTVRVQAINVSGGAVDPPSMVIRLTLLPRG